MADVLPPLVVHGSKLAIPQATAIQDGYLSARDFILFSGGTVVPVTSFNTRTGEVLLLEDDVLAALGYVPLNKHGDTMTGPLTLAGPPSLPLHAATRAYADSLITGASSGLIRGVYLASSFGASGSKLKFTGAVNSGSTTLTLATGSTPDFQVGHGIFITGAGAGGGNLLTKVDGVSGTTITLHDPAGTTRSSTNVQHDDTVALQAGLDQLGAVGGGTLLVEPLFYRVNGPVDPTFRSILKFPFWPAISGGRPPCFRVMSYNVPVAPGAGDTQELGAAIIQSDVVNTTASILASGPPDPDPTYANGTYSITAIEGITFRTYDNPQINGLDLNPSWNVFLRNVSFDTGMSGQGNIVFGGSILPGAEPTHGTFALRLPAVNYSTQVLTENLTISNYGIGVIGDELWHTTGTWIQRCGIGIQGHPGGGNYPIVGDLLIVQCKKDIDCSVGRMRFDCHVDFETDPSPGWWYTASHIYDPDNTAAGIIRWINIMAGSGGGASSSITVHGANNVSLWSLTGLGIKLADNPLSASGDLRLVGDVDCEALTSRGPLSIWDGAAQLPVSFGLDSSGGSGKRDVLIPNASTHPSLLTGLVSYWDMEEAGPLRADKTGHSPLGGTAFAVTGRVGNAAHGGVNQSLGAADNPFQHFAGSMSIAGWINITTLAGGNGYHVLLGKVTSSSDLSFMVWWRNDSGVWEFQARNSSGAVASVTITHTPTLNTWYHVAAVFDSGANQARLRINDGAIGSNSVSLTGPLFNTTATNLGSLGVYYGGYLWGDCAVDELGVWNKALSAGEITTLAAGIAYPF
jgi:hypothetical protein